MTARLAPLALAAAVLAGCSGGDDAAKRYEAACAGLPRIQAVIGVGRPDGRREQDAGADLRTAIDRVAAINDEPTFVGAMRQVGDAQAELVRARRTFATKGDPTDTNGLRGFVPVSRAADALADRYRQAQDAARDAGIDCPALASAGDAPNSAPSDPNEADVAAPEGLPETERAAFERGRDVLERAGCLACHRVGDDGGDLGPDLTDVGDRQTRGQLARVLVRPTSPMPSFKQLPARGRADLVTFMANLRG